MSWKDRSDVSSLEINDEFLASIPSAIFKLNPPPSSSSSSSAYSTITAAAAAISSSTAPLIPQQVSSAVKPISDRAAQPQSPLPQQQLTFGLQSKSPMSNFSSSPSSSSPSSRIDAKDNMKRSLSNPLSLAMAQEAKQPPPTRSRSSSSSSSSSSSPFVKLSLSLCYPDSHHHQSPGISHRRLFLMCQPIGPRKCRSMIRQRS